MAFQESMVISKQEHTQSISNSTMCHTLSAAENLAFRICQEKGKNLILKLYNGYKNILGENYKENKLIFDAYDSYDAGKIKSINDLKIQFIFLIDNFKYDYEHYKINYTNYNYPNNLNENQVKDLIYLWYQLLAEVEDRIDKNVNCSKYYKNFYMLLENNQFINYIEDIYQIESNKLQARTINPKTVAKETAKAQQHLENYVGNNAKNKTVELYGKNNLKMG